jgi:hypothetical protein
VSSEKPASKFSLHQPWAGIVQVTEEVFFLSLLVSIRQYRGFFPLKSITSLKEFEAREEIGKDCTPHTGGFISIYICQRFYNLQGKVRWDIVLISKTPKPVIESI